MSLRTIWITIVRWRFFLVPMLILGLSGGVYVFMQTPRTYTLEARYLFLSPVEDVQGISGNPFLQVGSGVVQTVDVLAVSLADGQTARMFTEKSPNLEYTATRDSSVGAPVMIISVEDIDAEVTQDTLTALGEILQERLLKLQIDAGAPNNQLITVTTLTADPRPELGFGPPARNGILVLGGVLAFALTILVFVERLNVARFRRRSLLSDGLKEAADRTVPFEPATHPTHSVRRIYSLKRSESRPGS